MSPIILFKVQCFPNLDCSSLESILLKVNCGSSNLALLGVYRPPSLSKSPWTNELSLLLENASALAKDTLMLGDLNCDLLQPDHGDQDGRALLDICDLYDIYCLVKIPTRITDSSTTLIDIILTINHHRFLHTPVLESHLSDHKLNCTSMKFHPPRSQPMFVSYRKMKDLNQEHLLEDLNCTPVYISHIFDDIDTKKYYDHIKPILKQLHWLPVNQRINYKILLLTYEGLNGQALSYITELLEPYTLTRSLRSSSKNLLKIPPS